MSTMHSEPELFQSKFLNKLAQANFHAAMFGYPLMGLGILLFGFYYTNVPWYWLLSLTLVSYFGWTLVEYTLHRYVYHEVERIPGMGRFQYIFHGIHHENPNREDKLIMPPAPWLLSLVLFFGLFYLVFGDYAFGIIPGLVFGYVSYVYVHYNIHRPNSPKWMQNHMIHHQLHHHRHHDKAFGVTTPLWDRVFGTMPPERIGWNK